MTRVLRALAAAATLLLGPMSGYASEMVTVDTFVRAETDMTLSRYAKQGVFGEFLHIRQPTPIHKQDVVRMNLDTLYSVGVFDLTTPVTILKPDSGGRFQSMMVINQDHSMLPVEHGAGEFTFSKDQTGSRYVIVVFRTFADANDPADIHVANALQDGITVRQKDPGTFEIPDWDEASLKKVRDALKVLGSTRTDAAGMFGDKAKLDPLSHLLGTTIGWGGNPEEAAMYDNLVPKKNHGQTPVWDKTGPGMANYTPQSFDNKSVCVVTACSHPLPTSTRNSMAWCRTSMRISSTPRRQGSFRRSVSDGGDQRAASHPESEGGNP